MMLKGTASLQTLPTGLSIIKISTDLDCQGVIERESLYLRGHIVLSLTQHRERLMCMLMEKTVK